MYFTAKTLISALIIALISELNKRYPTWAAVSASLPLMSILAMIWIYIEAKDTAPVVALSKEILILIPPSLILFILLPWLIRLTQNFWFSLSISAMATVAAYAGYLYWRTP